jgi:ABC-type dipeptide/oligopeptide/nickel transport system permease component
MAKQTKIAKDSEADSAYLLKLVMYFIFGSLWLHIETKSFNTPLPIGFGIGLIFASHDHFKIDRKIEFAVLVVALFAGFWLAPKIVLGF